MSPAEKLFAIMGRYPVILYGYLDSSKNDNRGIQTFKLFSSRSFFGDEQKNICDKDNKLLNSIYHHTDMEFKAYYLPSSFNNTTSMQLFNDADFFITDRLSGCTFLVIEKDEQIICYHINKLTDNGDIDIQAIEQETNDVLTDLGVDESSILLRVDKSDSDLSHEHLSVIGTRIDDVWSFHYQTYAIDRDISFSLNTTMREEQKMDFMSHLNQS